MEPFLISQEVYEHMLLIDIPKSVNTQLNTFYIAIKLKITLCKITKWRIFHNETRRT